MPRRLPPLTSLRAFEAAGRHLSFTKAAEELTVTQAAISHQVKALEEHLDAALFLRLPRQLELTKAGKILLPVVSNSFDRIGVAVAKLNKDVASSVLTVRLAVRRLCTPAATRSSAVRNPRVAFLMRPMLRHRESREQHLPRPVRCQPGTRQ